MSHHGHWLGVAGIAAAVAACGLAVMAQTPASFMLDVPAKAVPVPTTVSPQMQKIIGLPLRTNWNLLPKTGEEWKPVAEAGAAATMKNLPGISDRLKVKVEKTTMNGVNVFIVTPEVIAPNNRNRVQGSVRGNRQIL